MKNKDDISKTSQSGEQKQNFFVKTLNGMAYGLFATLIVGTIIGTIALIFDNGESDALKLIFGALTGLSTVLKNLTGAGIGIGIALTLNYDSLKTVVLGAIGQTASYFSLSTSFVENPTLSAVGSFQIGDPLTIYLVCIASVFVINLLFTKKTPVDILIVPLGCSLIGLLFALLIRYPSIYVTYAVQKVVNVSTNAVPLLSGMIIAVVMGMALTAPISSAAIAAIVFKVPETLTVAQLLADSSYSGLALASGAAVVGCSVQMIGFAIMSARDNDVGTVLSVGIGTSMLQFKNILIKPIIWLPTIIASAILGPISTCVVKTVCVGSSAGMGTAGIVGQIGTIASMGASNVDTWISIVLLQIVAPAILVWLLDKLFRKLNLIKDGDLKI